MNSLEPSEPNYIRSKSYKNQIDQLKKHRPLFLLIISCSLGIFFLLRGYTSLNSLSRIIQYIIGGILITPILLLLFTCHKRLIIPTPKANYDEVIV